MKENKKISVNTAASESEIEWNGIKINIKRILSFREMMEFVQSVVQLCFESETGSYIPEVKFFAIRAFMLEKYTDMDLPAEIEKKYKLIYSTDIAQTVMKHIDSVQFQEIVQAVDAKLDYITSANIEAQNKQMKAFYDSLERMETQFSDIFSGLDSNAIAKLMEEIIHKEPEDVKLIKADFVNKTAETSETEERLN